MKKKKIIITIIVIIIALFVVGLIANKIIKRNSSTTKFHVSEFKSIKELLEYYNCTDISIVNSNQKEFDKDIYLYFQKDITDNLGNTSQEYYENVISLVAAMMDNKNFRMIDKKRELTIEVKFRENGSAGYSINGDGKYFETIKSRQAINNMSDEKEIELNIKSSILNNIIKNDWEKTKVQKFLGTAQKKENSYDIYENEGYKVRTISSKIYNIILDANYKNEVFDGIKTGMDNITIKSMLGTPNYDNEDANTLIGYKTKDFYVFFNQGEISIYRVENFNEDENLEFANFFTELNMTGEYKEFLNRLTDLFPDYETYVQREDYIHIVYPLRGFELILGQKRANRLFIYGNYQGLITNTTSLEDIKNGSQVPANVYLKTDTDLVFYLESNRNGTEIYDVRDVEDEEITRNIIDDPNIYKEVNTALEHTSDEEFENYIKKLEEEGAFED